MKHSRLTLLLLWGSVLAGPVSAADKYFLGIGASWNDTNNWALNSGGPGPVTAVPGSGDKAIFDGNSGNCNIDAAVNVAGLLLTNGYTGTITQETGRAITVGSSKWVQYEGTFAGGDSAITINGAFTLTNGVFTSTTGTLTIAGSVSVSNGNFNHNSGTIVSGGGGGSETWDVPGSLTVNNLTLDQGNPFNDSLSIAAGDTIVVDGTLTLKEGLVNAQDQGNPGTLEAKGPIAIDAAADGGTATLLVSGVGDQSFTIANGGKICGLWLNSALTTVTFASGPLTNGIGGNFRLDAGTVEANSDCFRLDDDVTVNGGTFHHNKGSIRAGYAGGGETWTLATPLTFNDFEHVQAGDDSLTLSGTIVVTGNVTLTQGTLNGGTIELLNGNLSVGSSANLKGGTTWLVFTNSASQTYSVAAGGTGRRAPRVRIDKSGGSVSPAAGTADFFVKDFVLSNGTFTAPTGTFGVVAGVAGNFTVAAGTTFNHNSGILRLEGQDSFTVDVPTSLELGGLVVTNGSDDTMTISASDKLIVTRDFAFHHFLMNGGTIEAQGNVTIGTTARGGSTAMTFTGTNNQTYTDLGGNEPDGTFTMNKTSGSVTLASQMEVTGSGQNLIVTNGTLDLAGYNVTVNSLFDIDGTLKLKGIETISAGTFSLDTNLSTVVYYDSGVTAVLSNIPAKTFYNLTFGAGKAHEFGVGSGNEITVRGTLRSDGSSSSRSVLRSVGDQSSQSYLKLQGTSELGDKVSVKYSNAGNGITVQAPGSIDSGNNVNWNFAALGSVFVIR